MISTQQNSALMTEAGEKRRMSVASTAFTEVEDKRLGAVDAHAGSEEAETDAGSSRCLSEGEHDSEKDLEGLLAPAPLAPPPGLQPCLSFLSSSAEFMPGAACNLRDALRAKGHGILSKLPADVMQKQKQQKKGARTLPMQQQKKQIVQQTVLWDAVPPMQETFEFLTSCESTFQIMKVPVPQHAAPSRLNPDLPAKKKPTFAAELGLATELVPDCCPAAIAVDELAALY
eukprot:gb/GFBE01065254.1/.p1 GENE.gb/GFBE01065254.1/~~gb/GFBE01065254.1/.p1  ORF type:complete len:230 (+),score=61.60 gb/GFBE01065254.1/:1-690(+)